MYKPKVQPNLPVIAGLLYALIAPQAGALQPLITDDTGTQGQGGHQLELTFNRIRSDTANGLSRTRSFPLVYTYGATDTLDFYASVTRQRVTVTAPAESGWSNNVLGAKWRFYENETGKLSLALKPELRLPVSASEETRGLGHGGYSHGTALLLTREMESGAWLANLAVDHFSYKDPATSAGERRTRYRVSAARIVELDDRWKLTVDAGVLTHPERAARNRMGYVQAGSIYTHDKDTEIALGLMRQDGDRAARTTQLTLGLTVRFK